MTRRRWGHTLARRGGFLAYLVPAKKRESAQALLAELEEIEAAPLAVRWLLGGAGY